MLLTHFIVVDGADKLRHGVTLEQPRVLYEHALLVLVFSDQVQMLRICVGFLASLHVK